MADDLGTDTGALTDRLNAIRDQVQTSYQQSGMSDDTRRLLSQYVDVVVQSGLDVSESSATEQGLVEDVAGSLDLGVSDPAVFSAVEQQFADIRSGKHLVGGSPSQRNVERKADPVESFSGQFTQQVTDVTIDGAGMDFVFRRTYKSQAVYAGPLGANWDHLYNLYIRERGDDLVRSSGEVREDTYTRHPLFGQAGFSYWVPPDGRHGVIEEDGASFVWRSPFGARYRYAQDAADPTFHRLHEIRDRFGNWLAFSYQNQFLAHVEINHPGRFVRFDTDDLGRILSITDHTGRQWVYEYDDYGDLVSVTTPATARYPAGLTTTYEYSSEDFSPPLQHNLLRIIDPAGQLYLENEYGVDAGLLAFNRVVRQRQGGGEYFFEYETVVNEFDFDYTDSERPAIQVNHVQRNGQMVHLVYNMFGNLLLQEEYVSDGGRRLTEWRSRYNGDGALIGTITPEGLMTQYYYGRDDYLRVRGIEDADVATDDALTASARLAFGNLLAVVRRGRRYDLDAMTLNRGLWGDFFPDVLAATDPSDIIVKNTYEPAFQQIATVSDPRFTTSADPRFAEPPAYARHLITYEYQATPAGITRRIRYPDTTFPAPLPNGDVGLTNIADEYLRYDAHGRLELAQDPEGYLTEHRYIQPGPGIPGFKEGYLREVVQDLNGLDLTTRHEVNDVGLTTTVVNPRGFQTTFVVNALNQTIETVSAGPAFRSRMFFDRNGLLERRERDNLDDAGQPSPDGDEVRTSTYDEQNNLVRETWGGVDLAGHHVVRHRYNGSDQRVETIRPRGNRLRIDYDERMLQKAVVRGATSPKASTTRRRHDGDKRVVETIDGRGYSTRSIYDTFDRVVRVVDPLGNVQQREYDKRGNVTLVRTFEPVAAGGFQLLKRRTLEYDERSNLIRETGFRFNSPIPTADIVGAPDQEFTAALTLGQVTPVETRFFYDRNRRLFRRLNGKGQEATWEYDGANRRTVERDALGNFSRTFYDENSNVVRVDRHELIRDPQTGAPLGEEVFSTLKAYDPLDRLTDSTDGLGNRTTYTYDSRNNIASMTDPLGRVVRSVYDVFGRKTQHVAAQTTTGIGGGPPLPPVVTRFGYDDNDNLVSAIDARDSETQFVYDELDRAEQTVYADGTSMGMDYDADDGVTVERDNNGLRAVHQIDPLKRRTRTDLDTSGLDPRFPYPARAETFGVYQYDGAGRMTRHVNDFASVSCRFDSFDGAYEERIDFATPNTPPAGTQVIGRAFDVLSNRTSLTLPSGRSIEYEYDDLNRLTRIVNADPGTAYPGSQVFGPQYAIAAFHYRGLRQWRTEYANHTGCELAFDAAGRTISTRHFDAGGTALELQQLFDGAGNRRLRIDGGPMAGAPNGERYAYDSLSRLTNQSAGAMTPIVVAPFAPMTTPQPAAALTGQQAIDAAIGSLAQNPVNPTYQYDAVGNRQALRMGGQPPVAYVPNALNEYDSVDSVPFQYDLNGNLLDDGQRQYAYNYRNQLVRVLETTPNVERLRQCYDAIGRAIAIVEGGSTAHLIVDGLHVIEEYVIGAVRRQYVYEHGIDRRCQMAAGGEEWWYHADLLRSTRLLSDSTGQVPASARFDYEPFGASRGTVIHDNPFFFAGKRRHRDLELYDSRTRQYAPLLGRFLQRDPKGLRDGINLFAYVGNNPVNFVDAMGTEKRPITRDGVDSAIEGAARAFRADPLSIEGAEAIGFGFMWFLSGDATTKDGQVLTSKEKQAAATHLSLGFGEKTSGYLVGEHEFNASELMSEWKANALAMALLVVPRVFQARSMSRELAMDSSAFRSWNADHQRATEVFDKVLKDAHPLEGPGLRKGIEMMAWENWKLTDILFKRNGQSGQGLDLFFRGAGENAGMNAFLESKASTLALKTVESVFKEVGMEVRQGSWTYIELQLQAHANGGQHAALAQDLAHELRLQLEGITEQSIKSFGSTSTGYLYELNFLETANFKTEPWKRSLVHGP